METAPRFFTNSSAIAGQGPPGYPSAWLHPCRDRFRFTWRGHCSRVRRMCKHRCRRPAELPLVTHLFELAIAYGANYGLSSSISASHSQWRCASVRCCSDRRKLESSAAHLPLSAVCRAGCTAILAICASAPAFRSIADSKARFARASCRRCE